LPRYFSAALKKGMYVVMAFVYFMQQLSQGRIQWVCVLLYDFVILLVK